MGKEFRIKKKISKMPEYKLTYFNARGRAELTRLVFAASGVEFKDVRIEKEEWLALKDKTPLGQLPVLEVDGVQLPQSLAMARYVAKEYNLAGKNNLEQAQVDAIVDTVMDFAAIVKVKVMLVEDPEEKAKAFAALIS